MESPSDIPLIIPYSSVQGLSVLNFPERPRRPSDILPPVHIKRPAPEQAFPLIFHSVQVVPLTASPHHAFPVLQAQVQDDNTDDCPLFPLAFLLLKFLDIQVLF